MKNFYIYSGTSTSHSSSDSESYAVIFCSGDTIETAHINRELKEYFQKESLPDDIYIIGGNFLEGAMIRMFVDDFDKTFLHINKVTSPNLNASISIYTFDQWGTLNAVRERKKRDLDYLRDIVRDGTARIFVERGGLVESKYSHHFVFPSGKHSERFLRTGNVLLYSSEVYFIAFQLLKYYDTERHFFIQCDTSSINSVAFALLDLKRRTGVSFNLPPINSFKSYSIFEDEEIRYAGATLYLISASTSGGIIQRIKERIPSVMEDSIVLLYYLGDPESYVLHALQIICNLDSKAYSSGIGLKTFETYKAHECRHCRVENSLAINVIGDVFLLESPKVQKILLKVTHAPSWLNDFAHEFIPKNSTEAHVLKCHYRDSEDPDERFDIFFDMNEVLSDPVGYRKFSDSLKNQINSQVPLNTKYIITLDDSASQNMANQIAGVVSSIQKIPPIVLTANEIPRTLKSTDEGAVIIVSSCLVSGISLSMISKMLREYPELARIYFTGLVRTRNDEKFRITKSNLTKGLQDANDFVVLRQINIPDTSRFTEWSKEENFLQGLINFIQANDEKYAPDVLEFYRSRLNVFIGVDNLNRGISHGLFYRNVWDLTQLKLNKNFAFLEFEAYERVSHSDVYFIISSVLHNLRTRGVKSDNLHQSEYLRNILDPENFSRFNDGIIQSAILRAATPLELAYNLDVNVSNDVADFLEHIFDSSDTNSNEAAIEFFYALIVKKMQLRPTDYQRVIKMALAANNNILNAMYDYSQYKEAQHKTKRNPADSTSTVFQDGEIQ